VKAKEKPDPELVVDLLKPCVELQLAYDSTWAEPCNFLLCIDNVEAGIVLGRVVTNRNKSVLSLNFNWADVVNASAFALFRSPELKVELAPIVLQVAKLQLGTISRKLLESFMHTNATAENAVLVELAHQRRSGLLPNAASQLVSDATLVAFYLPQYHPIIENDIWWGAGFTEWTKVAAAKPQFRGHNQPRLPGELGFYDLRVADVLARQAALAREHGIGAFCFYYYWFGGRRLLERPMALFLESPQIDMPFCICWANEPWTRRWDGLEEDVLIDQPHTPEVDARFILDAIPILKDPRYLRLNGKPLLLVYRAALISIPNQTTALWRQLCRDAGLGEIELAAIESFGFENPDDFGFDSTVEFPPHGFEVQALDVKPLKGKKNPFEGKAWHYSDAVAFYRSRPPKPWRRFRGVMPGWDNTPRRGRKGFAFVKSSPERYGVWLEAALKDTRTRFGEGERLIFINAWNEWGEGAILEPDQANGRKYLEMTRAALQDDIGWEQQLARFADAGERDERERLGRAITAQIQSYHRTLDFMIHQQTNIDTPKASDGKIIRASEIWPDGLLQDQPLGKALGSIDQLGPPNHQQKEPLLRHKPIQFHGWMVLVGYVPNQAPPLYLAFIHKETRQVFFATLTKRFLRPDLPEALALTDPGEASFAGFDGLVDCSSLPVGHFSMELLMKVADEWSVAKPTASLVLA
jgi:hypothetical protein